jgi:DNA-binding transcriptional MerR regulator
MCAKAVAELADAKERGYYSIGRAAELSGVTAKMIRHYESLELIPKAARTLGDYRVYTASDIHKLRFIRRARGLGFSIDEIGTLLSLWQNERRASKEVKRLRIRARNSRLIPGALSIQFAECGSATIRRTRLRTTESDTYSALLAAARSLPAIQRST